MTWIEKLLGKSADKNVETEPISSELIEVQKVLNSLDQEKAPYVACIALLAARLAGADYDISDGEKQRIAKILQEQGHLTAKEAQEAAEIATAQELANSIEHFRVTELFNEISTEAQRREIVHALFYVACDEDISELESEKIRAISSALLISNTEYLKIRSEYSQHRTLLKNLPKG